MVVETISIRAVLEESDKLLPLLFILSTCIKILLIPSYRSTDFDVHRNWLAITRQLPTSEWYWNDVDGTTVHTLDYPPAFALFEYILSNNPVTSRVLPPGDRCLKLLPDTDNEPSEACVLFQRSTVIIGDIILWAGAYFACRSYHYGRPVNFTMTSFVLIVFNPALLWLDHIHFQYNGMMIGVLLASLGCLMMGNNVDIEWRKKETANNQSLRRPIAYDLYHLAGAGLFALLLNLKHLYLSLAPLYFCYLLERYCLTYSIPPGKTRKQLLPKKFLLLALVTGTILVLPWLPFVLGQHDPKAQVQQILRRLFPFGRGLVHDYWAGNVWAIYSLADRIYRLLVPRIIPYLVPISPQLANILEGTNHLPEPSPLFCAIALLISIIPGLQMASLRLTNKKLIEAVVYVSFCAFMLAYHVHEKAILTTLVPLTLLVEPSPRGEYHNLLYWHMALYGLLGILPLLFRPIELTFKLSSYLCYMGLTSYLLQIQIGRMHCALCVLVIGILDVVPIQGKWEFLPLMVTSIACAFGLLGCWGVAFYLLIRKENPSS